ncbi:uncharacterized protein K489DRAFT_326775 [Dissoconium aciculare CBS 342.82]|jgi:hypothetical protein|uniref:Antigenic cell wall galactomannoprotein n=1 Tax=Dissoconium aciculare CBS 342.82 TaxID=1314786 RepID=A0A6J3LT32_9PEZI|nr:uncharacterized protein K489DRAFT_326775 [Dissoconium aciculare CBS 342.82]KAF1818808.1 hypothetical protein K489DRAFT_326775 [Dissoconium aciculare CBS 342.82]
MLFKSLAIVGFAATAVVADGAAIVKSLGTIRQKNAAFNGTLVKWDGSLFGAIPILTSSGDLNKAVDAGTKVAKASAPLSLDEATQVYIATQSLQGEIVVTIDNLIAAKPKFDKAGVTVITTSTLSTSRKSAAAFGAAVVEKVPADLQSFAQGVVGSIDAEFARAQAVYGKPLF